MHVYDHSEPPAGFQDVLPAGTLTPGQRVIVSVIRRLDCAEVQLKVLAQPAASTQRQMLP